MTKGSLKDKLEGSHLDLSLSGLTTVPVKEIIALRKVTSLDLSCNLLKSLPDDFCTLTQLMKVDLSKNELHELPENFGALHNLRHLDLLGNQLSALPVGCCSLDELRWLDLKDNPLEPGLRAAAGDCLDEAQCRKCAKQVVLYMKQVQSAMESQRQKLLQQERALEAAQREAEQLDKRAAKQADKERRRADYASKQKQQQQEEEEAAAAAAALTASAASEAAAHSAGIGSSARPGARDGDRVAKVGARQRGRSGCCAILGCSLLAVLAVLLLGAAAAYFYCGDAQGGTSALASGAAEQCHLVASAVASLRRQAEERLRAVRQRLEL